MPSGRPAASAGVGAGRDGQEVWWRGLLGTASHRILTVMDRGGPRGPGRPSAGTPAARRRAHRAPPPMAATGDETPLELEVRVPPGQESVAEREIGALGHEVELRGRGELRVRPAGPMRPLLQLERPLAIYAVRQLRGVGLEDADGPGAVTAAMELAAVVANLGFKGKLASYRVTTGPGLVGDRRAIGRLAATIGRRLGVAQTVVGPELILIVRQGRHGLELAARLPRLA